MNRNAPARIAPEISTAAADWFTRLQEEEVAQQDFQDWQQWLAAAPEHRRAYGEIERAWRLIGEVKPAPWATPQQLKSDPPPNSGRVESRSRPRVWWALAATMVLGLFILFSMSQMSHGDKALSTKTAEQRSVRLSDGSRVILGAQSRVTPQFDGKERRLTLEFGEAFFEVARDPKRPFTVVSGGSEIRAVGTAFNVRATADRVLVSVTEGRVAVASAPASRAPAEILLSAGEQASITRTGAHKQTVATTAAVTWLEGRFEYRGETLRHVIDDLNRYTDRPVTLSDERLGELRYSGTVFPDHVDEWLQGIGGALPVSVRETGSTREIVGTR
jgi:transmembrane sensor